MPGAGPTRKVLRRGTPVHHHDLLNATYGCDLLDLDAGARCAHAGS
ncbi:MAG: hypothetical protein NTX54_13045 [Chloroflexi bacterium]|nr:hypothetical protein [Chloroflexota bacterium]